MINRFLIVVFVAALTNSAHSAAVTFGDGMATLAENGVLTADEGMLTADSQTVHFSVDIAMSNANSGDSAFVEASDSGIRFWISDGSGAHDQWQTVFVSKFDKPMSGLKIAPQSPGNTADDVDWTVSWSGTDDAAILTNSPAATGEHSLYLESQRLQDGEYTSGIAFRLDDDATRAGDSNGSQRGDLNLSIPSDPWSIVLPDGTTEFTIEARLTDAVPQSHAFEGIGVDMTSAFAIPEPACLPMVTICLIGFTFACGRKR